MCYNYCIHVCHYIFADARLASESTHNSYSANNVTCLGIPHGKFWILDATSQIEHCDNSLIITVFKFNFSVEEKYVLNLDKSLRPDHVMITMCLMSFYIKFCKCFTHAHHPTLSLQFRATQILLLLLLLLLYIKKFLIHTYSVISIHDQCLYTTFEQK